MTISKTMLTAANQSQWDTVLQLIPVLQNEYTRHSTMKIPNDDQGRLITILTKAIEEEKLDVVQAILKLDPPLVIKNHPSLYQKAFLHSDTSYLEALVQHDPLSLCDKMNDGLTPVEYAAQNKKFDLVIMMAQALTHFNIEQYQRDVAGLGKALLLATVNNEGKAVAALMKANARPVQVKSVGGYTFRNGERHDGCLKSIFYSYHYDANKNRTGLKLLWTDSTNLSGGLYSTTQALLGNELKLLSQTPTPEELRPYLSIALAEIKSTMSLDLQSRDDHIYSTVLNDERFQFDYHQPTTGKIYPSDGKTAADLAAERGYACAATLAEYEATFKPYTRPDAFMLLCMAMAKYLELMIAWIFGAEVAESETELHKETDVLFGENKFGMFASNQDLTPPASAPVVAIPEAIVVSY